MARRELWEQVDADLYQILGVPETASDDDIAEAWRSVAKRTHPDRGGSVGEFQGAEVAYQVLSDPLERRRYDRATRFPAVTPNSVPRMPAGGGSGGGFSWSASSWTASSWAPGTGPDAGYVPQYEYDYRDPGPSPKLNLWVVVLTVLLVLIAIAAFFFMAAFTLLMIFAVGVTLVGRLFKTKSKSP